MARQFKEVWRALDICYDDFIQTSEDRHHAGCRKFIQKVFDAGYIYKGLRGLGTATAARRSRPRRKSRRPAAAAPSTQDAATYVAEDNLLLRACRISRTGCWTSTR